MLIGMALAGVLAFAPKPIEVETAILTEGALQVSVLEDGKTRIREKYIVSSPVAGRLSRIELNPGDDVCCDGTLIAIILPADPTMLDARSKAQAEARVQQTQSALRRAQANAAQVQVNFNLSQSKFDRAESLIRSNAISRDEFDVAQSELLSLTQSVRTTKFDCEIAEFELKMAEAALMQFDVNEESAVDPFEVHAPITGKVLRVFQESATVVGVGTPLIELGDPENLEMEIDVLSTDAVRILPLSELTIDHWGGEEPLKGSVRIVEPAAFTKISSLGVEEQRVNVIADFDEPVNRIANLGDGYRIEAKIVVDQIDNALLVPNSALFRHQRLWHVFTIVNDRATLTLVEIGAQNESFTQVLSGLNQSDEVIVFPSDKIATGVKIRRAQ